MNNGNHAPKFWEAFAEALHVSAQIRGFRAFIPWWFLLCLLVGSFLGWCVAAFFNIVITQPNAVNTLASMMVVGGLLGAVSIACLAQVHIILSNSIFASFLQKEGLFDRFLFWPQFGLMVQITFVLSCALGVFLVSSIKHPELLLGVLGGFVGLMLYAMSKAWNLVDLLRILAWHKQDFDRILREESADCG